MFAPGIFSQDSMITDGLSNTIAMTEMGAIGQRSVLGQVAIRQPADLLRSPAKHKFLLDERNSKLFRDGVELADYRRGWRWADGRSGVALVNTVLPPNNASFAMGVGLGADGIFTAASHHTKIVNVLRGDGSVSPVSETIDCGSPQVVLPSNAEMLENPSLSPLGVWGALGTAASEDVVESP